MAVHQPGSYLPRGHGQGPRQPSPGEGPAVCGPVGSVSGRADRQRIGREALVTLQQRRRLLQRLRARPHCGVPELGLGPWPGPLRGSFVFVEEAAEDGRRLIRSW